MAFVFLGLGTPQSAGAVATRCQIWDRVCFLNGFFASNFFKCRGNSFSYPNMLYIYNSCLFHALVLLFN